MEKFVRISTRVPEDTRAHFKILCAARRVTISDMLLEMITDKLEGSRRKEIVHGREQKTVGDS